MTRIDRENGIVGKADGCAVGVLWICLIENDRMAKAALRVSRACLWRGDVTETLGAAAEFCFS